MADWTDTADPLRYGGHLPIAAPQTKLLESPELGHVEAGISHLTGVIQMNGDFCVPFDTGYR
jgi:hypothetical protein